MNNNPLAYSIALADFNKARRKAAMEQLLARFSDKPADLLSYEEVRQHLQLTNKTPRGLQDIPVEKIIGSVGRYKDFTRSFAPKQDSDESRWATVKTAVEDNSGLPPIDVYQVGDAYFVIDGNHRVSIARQMAAPTVSAYVTEVKTRIPLNADDDLDEVIIKAQYAEFLDSTHLDELRPGADLLMTFSGQYRLILEHIDVHRYYLGLENKRDVSYEEAVCSWYDHVYMPVIEGVREQGVLRYFIKRTEADIYVLLAEHRAELAEALDWDVSPETAVVEMAKQTHTPWQAIVAAGNRLLSAIIPDELEGAPQAGTWRMERVSARQSGTLFNDIMVPLSTNQADWRTLEMGILIAQLGGSRLLGLHVIDAQSSSEKEKVDMMRAGFEARCREVGVKGQFAVEEGEIGAKIVQRSIYADGVIIPFNHPPASISERYSSGLQMILRRSPRPVLTVPPGEVNLLTHALLAYGGSQTTADEALFVAAYLNARYHIRLSVISVGDNIVTNKALARVRKYLVEIGAEADFYAEDAPVEEAIKETAVQTGADFLIMGSISYSPLRSLLLGSTANRLLPQYEHPILFCR